MQRQLKFRAYDKLAERFIKCDEGYQGHYVLSLKGEFHNLQNGSGGKEYVVQQYTGLKDKNGTEIYEGDIIQLTTGETGIVKFENGSFYHNAKSDVNGQIYWNEIIGNIFENSELLEA